MSEIKRSHYSNNLPPDLRRYSKMENVSPFDLIPENNPTKSIEFIARTSMLAGEGMFRGMDYFINLGRNLLLTYYKVAPVKNRAVLESKSPWLKEKGDDQRSKRLNLEIHKIFPEELLDSLDRVWPGAKKSWESSLGDMLDTTPENELRMYLTGMMTGIAIALVQNGENTFAKLHMPVPSDIVFATQTIINFIIPGFRWVASNSGNTISRNVSPLFGKSLQQIIDQESLPPGFKKFNATELVDIIISDYLAQETGERFLKNFNGMTLGLFVGNLILGRPQEALIYSLIAQGADYAVKKGYSVWIDDLVKQIAVTINHARGTREKEAAVLNAVGIISSDAWNKAKNEDHKRRELATYKNVFQYIISGVLPTLAAWLAKQADPQSAIATNLYTYSQIFSSALERTTHIGAMTAAHINGQRAIVDFQAVLEEIIAIRERFTRINNQELPLSHSGNPILKNVSIPEFQSAQGDMVNELNLDKPVELEKSKLYLVVGGIQTGKTTFLRTLESLVKYHGRFLRVPTENQKEYDLGSKLVSIISSFDTELGTFGQTEIRRLINPSSQQDVEQNPIVLAFLEYCRANEILQGENGITAEWFSKRKGFIPSGSQQLFLNAAMHAMIDGNRVIMFDDPEKVLDNLQRSETWLALLTKLLEKGHTVLLATNLIHDFERYRLLDENKRGQVIDMRSATVSNLSDFLTGQLTPGEESQLAFKSVGLDFDEIMHNPDKSFLWEKLTAIDPFRLYYLISQYPYPFGVQFFTILDCAGSFCEYWKKRGLSGNKTSSFDNQLKLLITMSLYTSIDNKEDKSPIWQYLDPLFGHLQENINVDRLYLIALAENMFGIGIKNFDKHPVDWDELGTMLLSIENPRQKKPPGVARRF